MRKKPNLQPRMDRCAHVLATEPEIMAGRWLEGFPACRQVHLELGCGKGRFTAQTALTLPDTLLVAVEKVPDAMVVAMERVCAAGAENVRFIDRDAVFLEEMFAPGEIERIYINFPDPWLKTKQYKRRLTAPAFLAIYEKLLVPGGQLWFKTDNSPLFEWSLERLQARSWTILELSRDLHADGPRGIMTDYEAKFHEQGVKINRLAAARP